MAKDGKDVSSVEDALKSLQLEQQADQANCQEALLALAKQQKADAEAKKKHAHALKQVEVKPEDVAYVQDQFMFSKEKAERTLRENNADLAATIKLLLTPVPQTSCNLRPNILY